MRLGLSVIDQAERAVDYAIFTSVDGGRSAFIDGNALVHEVLMRRSGPELGVVTVGSIGGYRATTYRREGAPGVDAWSVTCIEAP